MRSGRILSGVLLIAGIALLLTGCPLFLFPDSADGNAESPIARFVADPVMGVAPLAVRFDAGESSTPNGEIVSYRWTFGDGEHGTGVSVSHTYRSMGIYTATLTVKNDSGLENSTETRITVAGQISYDELFRHNERHIGDIVYFRGRIVQVHQPLFGGTVWRVATAEIPLIGYIDDELWVNYDGPRYLEGDIIDLIGEVKGLKTYTAILGNQVTIPELDAIHVELVKKAGEQ